MIYGFIGDIGSGKTLSMTKFLYEKFLKGNDVITNYKLKFKKVKSSGKILSIDKKFFEDYNKSGLELYNSSVAIDEAHVFIDSRGAMSKKNKLFSKFITQSRKRSVDFLYTTQDVSIHTFYKSGQVDLRLRKLTDIVIFCRKLKVNKNLYVVQEFYKNPGIKIGQKVIPMKPYFKLYDTNEIIDIE